MLWAPPAGHWRELSELLPMKIPGTDIFVHDLHVNAAGRWFLIAAAAILGGIFGSFMNVVAYRLPRGMSLSRPGSHCPACQRPIRWYDNVPVLGWIRLGGRCRDCGARISARYPLVEALVAAIAALLIWRATGSWTADASVEGGGIFQVDVTRFAFHLLLMCTLVTAALVELDGRVPRARLIWLPCGIGLLMLVFWPSLQLVGDLIERDGAWAGLSGMLVAVVIGGGPWVCAWMSKRPSALHHANAALGELILVGAFLGDRAVVPIGVGSMTVYFIMKLAMRVRFGDSPLHAGPLPRRGDGEGRETPVGRLSWVGCLAVVTLIWIVVVVDPSMLPESSGFLGHAGVRLLAAAVVMTLLAAMMTFLAHRHRLSEPR
jgi:prepilin signal peptidase PulO-like enzyme (type II secretory pathway)